MRAGYEAWNAGDMDAFRDLYDPNVIVRPVPDWPEPGPWVGREAVMRQWEQMRDAWSGDVVEPISNFIDAADRVVVRQAWRGAGHGPDMNMEITNVFMLRKARIVYQEFFWDHSEALEAVGLSKSAMPRENVEIVRGVSEAFNRHDPEAALAWLAQDVEWHDLPDQPDAEVHHGHQDFLVAFDQFFAELDDYRVKLDETIDRGEQIIVCGRITGRGRGSGARFEQRVVGVSTMRNGLVVRAVWFGTREEALEAVGLAE